MGEWVHERVQSSSDTETEQQKTANGWVGGAMEKCLAFHCLGVSVPMHGPYRVPSTSEICLADCLGAPVRVLGMESNKVVDNGLVGGVMDMCLAFLHLHP